MTKVAQKRSKTIYIILSIVLAIIAVAGISVAFLLNYNTYAPEAPLVLDDGQNIYISTTLNDNYEGYRFKFIDENNEEVIIDSKTNQVSVEEMLENKIVLGNEYKVCYLAENVGNNSHYSKETTWKCQKYLDMPQISFDESYSILSWQEVENADYYRIYINGENDFIETVETSINLSSLEGGEKTINVVSYSNNSNYLTSNKSNTLQVRLIRAIPPFSFIEFNTLTPPSIRK